MLQTSSSVSRRQRTRQAAPPLRRAQDEVGERQEEQRDGDERGQDEGERRSPPSCPRSAHDV